jgi:hypothetical protein
MAGFLFRLETVDGVAADPPTLEAAVPNWKAGDSIYFGHRDAARGRDTRRRRRPAACTGR